MKAKQVSFESLTEAVSKFVSGKDIFEALAEMPGTPVPSVDYEAKLREVAQKAHEFAEHEGIKDTETVCNLAAFVQKWFMEGVALGRQEVPGTMPQEP